MLAVKTVSKVGWIIIFPLKSNNCNTKKQNNTPPPKKKKKKKHPMIQQSKFKTCTSSHTYFVNHDKPHQINNFFVCCNTKKLNIPILMADSSTKFVNKLCTHPCSWIIMYTCTLATQKPDNLRSAVLIYIY